ncbi:F-box/kelch-repeat protein At3g23880-like [Silene latifolia]|uniref:F-box/kelch-repeat protein At3g23880-like n=1 Tax=Silene latifolia TaxID=37657 RepID=UPI003D777A29
MVDRRVPLDLIIEILVWLPAKSALRFKCVCKDWYNLINSPLFAKLHLNKSLISDSQHNRIFVCTDTHSISISIVDDMYNPLKWIQLNWPKGTLLYPDTKHPVGFCNGLILVKVSQMIIGTSGNRDYMDRCFLICNPTTRTFKSILPCSERKWTDFSFLSYGFGYDIEHDDYKIVVTKFVFGEDDRPVCIYSLKTGLWSWTDLPTSVSIGRCNWIIKSEAIYVNNMLYYLVSLLTLGPIKEYKIIRFDVVYEKWRDNLSLPVKVNGDVDVGVGELDGRLYLHVVEYGVESSDIWMMEEYGSWNKMFHLPKVFQLHHLIACSKDGRQHLLLQDYNGHGDVLQWYDQQNNKRIPLKLKPPPKDRSAIMLSIASLIPIPGCSLTKLQEMKN